MDIDELGLDEIDTQAARVPSSKCTAAARSGSRRIAAALGEEAVTLEDVCEPYLMQLGFLTRTPRGRCADPQGLCPYGLSAAAGDGRPAAGPAVV